MVSIKSASNIPHALCIHVGNVPSKDQNRMRVGLQVSQQISLPENLRCAVGKSVNQHRHTARHTAMEGEQISPPSNAIK